MDPVEEKPARDAAANDDRIPCEDGMCTGILDPRGVCGTCGRAGDVKSTARASGVSDTTVDDGDNAPDSNVASGVEGAGIPDASTGDRAERIDRDAASGEGDGEDERVPCKDEMCVGIVGTDGRCGTCGKAG